MHDLDVWRRLATTAVTPSDLHAVANLAIGRRGPYIGRIAPLVGHGDPAIRAAAIRALAGCAGAPGVRAVVEALDDDDDGVRGAAIHALMVTAIEAPARAVHGLFHSRVDVRRAILATSLPQAVAEIAIYLRADPECADLAATLAWPAAALPLALDLHDSGHVPSSELVAVIARRPVAELRALFETEQRRSPEQVDAYLDEATRVGRPLPASGRDVMDSIVSALASVAWPSLEAWTERHERANELEMFVAAVTAKRRSHLARRAAVALASYFASHPAPPVLVAACAAIEPRTIELGLDTTAAATGLVRFKWPVSATPAQVERLVRRSAGDLALATALVGLLPSGRLDKLAELVGNDAIIDALVASDRGWDEICLLSGESPALEIRWLSAVFKRDPRRYTALHARAILRSTGKRLERFVDSTARQSRRAVFGAALLRAHDAAAIPTICKAIADRLDRTTLAEIMIDVLRDDDRRAPILLGLVRAVPEKILATAIAGLDDAEVARVIAILEGPDAPPRDRELAIARMLASRTDPRIFAWAARVTSPSPEPAPARRLVEPQRTLDAAERKRISTCSIRDLARAIEPALTAPVAGLVEALALRSPQPSEDVCAALLGCADPVDAVARQLDRFSAPTREFEVDLDNAATVWRGRDDVSPMAHARLYRWEHHIFALIRWIDSMGGVLPALRHVELHPGWLFAQTMWRGISEAVMFYRYRDLTRFHRAGGAELAGFAAERVDRHYGHHAARIVVALVEGGAVPVIAIRASVLDRIADASAETRAYAARLVRLDGIPEPPRAADLGDPRQAIGEIRIETDLDRLIAWCADPRASVVQEAALALVIAGEPGQRRLAELLSRLDSLAVPVAVLGTIVLWDVPAALERARQLAAVDDLPPAWRFHLAVALGDLPRAFESARDTTETWYFRRDDWDSLVRAAGDLATAIALADAPHHHAYQRAIPVLLAHDPATVAHALRRFLEVDGERPLHLRRLVARYLAERLGDFIGLPLLVEQVLEEDLATWEVALAAIPDAAITGAIELVVSAALVGGHAACSERRMWAVLERARSTRRADREVLDRLCGQVLEDASVPAVRRAAAAIAINPDLENSRLARVAEVFAWGVRRGVELTGRMFRFRATGKETDLGHTNLKSSEVFVSPLPMLRDEPHGQDVVEGLVLHELGHHIYHRAPGALELWRRAHAEGIGHLLNLVADEHLERNLRGVDAAYGDRLKRLGAYAFHHAPQEIPVAKLVASLRGSTARALIAADLGVAYDDKSVRLRRGEVIATLDRAGHPLARFMRALRMGLGNRHGDPIVAAALAQCGAKLRDLDMPGLYALTHQLAAMFGGATAIAQVFGGPEGLEFGERDDDVFGGLDDEILQREVERILDPRTGGGSARRGPRDRLAINVNPGEEFSKISRVERVRGDAADHRAIARDVARHSSRLRACLDDLGLRWEPAKGRLAGRMLDRGRLRSLVTKNDPRILIARRPVRKTDLFLGTIVDCSGSMSVGDNIARARRFAIMVAEAVAPLAGVEARFFGFTDSVIYDAGNADDCDVVALASGGGNNDAAALYHVANIAAASQKRARIVVMISDGLPTECSVAALRGLVQHLSRRRGVICAQVAVRALEEICFPHYVVLDDSEMDVAVARFGRLIGELARRSLAS